MMTLKSAILTTSLICALAMATVTVVHSAPAKFEFSAQNGKISAQIIETPLKLVLERIRKQTGLDYVITDHEGTQPVSVQFSSLSLEEALSDILLPFDYALKLDDQKNPIQLFVVAKELSSEIRTEGNEILEQSSQVPSPAFPDNDVKHLPTNLQPKIVKPSAPKLVENLSFPEKEMIKEMFVESPGNDVEGENTAGSQKKIIEDMFIETSEPVEMEFIPPSGSDEMILEPSDPNIKMNITPGPPDLDISSDSHEIPN